MSLTGLIFFSVAASGIGQLLLRSGAGAAVPVSTANMGQISTWISLLFNWPVVVGLLAWAVSTLIWVVVLNRAELSYAYCLGSLNYVFIPLISRWLFNESLNGVRLFGIAFIFVGVLITIYGRYGI